MKKRIIAIILAALMLLTACGKASDAPAPTDGTQPTSESTLTQPTDAPTEPTSAPTELISEYIVEDGALIAYTGSDTVLILPDEVTTIRANAFKGAPSAAQITTVRLGAAVQTIEVGAFSGMFSLSTFEVDPMNPTFYVYSDHALASTDGTLYFGVADEEGKRVNGCLTVLSDIEEGILDGTGLSRFVLGPAVVELEIDKDVWLNDSNQYYVGMTSVQAYGQKHDVDGSFHFNGNVRFSMEEGDGFFAVTYRQKDFHTWIVTEDGTVAIEDSFQYRETEENCNRSIVEFYREDGDIRLRYKRVLAKYYSHQSPGAMLEYCVARDEFCREEGFVTMENGQIVYTPETVETADDYYNLERQFEQVYSWESESGVNHAYQSLDEMLAANAQKYERGY